MTAFAPITRKGTYLPIEDHGLIGDGTTAALVGRDGAITWMCVPRFDSPPLFCGILDSKRGGAFQIAPTTVVASRQYYLDDTGILVTEFRTPDSLVRLTDALTLRAGADLREGVSSSRDELVRVVEVLDGQAEIRISLEPRGGVEFQPAAGGFRLNCGSHSNLTLTLTASRAIPTLPTTLVLGAGESVSIALKWAPWSTPREAPATSKVLEQTADAWRSWMQGLTYEGPQGGLVRRSAITLKMLDYFPSGAMVAAPTSSLPEAIGGPRNWDYRYAWIRDAAFSVYALRRAGLNEEAARFLSWVLDTVERDGRPRVLYSLDGDLPRPETVDPELEGYRASHPVRWGNAAMDQVQHDVFGEILDCAYQWARHHGSVDRQLWARLRPLVEAAARQWRRPDHGIWEVRTAGRPFTYSAAMCHVALDRGARLAEQFGLPGDVAGWRAEAQRIVDAIHHESWNPAAGAFTEHLGGGSLDASALALPLRRVISARHPAMVATVESIAERLGAGDGLLYRYLPEESPDGLPGHEGAFVLCSFWLTDNLALQGRIDEAVALYDSLCARANRLGLLPEQIDPATGTFLGNFPQAFSHVGLISTGVLLGRLTAARPFRPAGT